MKVLFVTAEISPYIRIGNLADISSFVSNSLDVVTTISPLYSSIDRSFLKLVKKDIVVYYDSKSYTFELFRSKDSLFLSNSIFDEIYPTSALTYTIFSLALLEIIDEYDIVHINDWHFGLLSHLIWLDKNKSQKVIFSIYNILYQGIYEFEDFKGIQNLDDGEFFGKLNILKLAVNSADIVTFTSKNYLEYIISTNLFSMGNFIREKLHKIEISNSLVDLKLFDPQNDEDIYHNYTARDFSNKKSNKKELLKNLKQTGVNKPLFGVIGIYDYSMELLSTLFESFSEFDFNIIVLLEQKSEKMESFKNRYENIIIIDDYSLEFAKRLYSGSDFLLSLLDVAQINELIASKYGTIPIVRDDFNIKDFSQDTKSQVGIKIKASDRYSLLEAITRGFFLYSNKSKFLQMAIENMYKDVKSSNYFDIYKKSLE